MRYSPTVNDGYVWISNPFEEDHLKAPKLPTSEEKSLIELS